MRVRALRVALLVVAALGLAFPAQAMAGPGLSGYWPFDEGRGVAAADVSGNGNDGVITGASWVPGRFKGALHFAGGDDVRVPNSPELESEFVSVEAWVMRSGSPGPLKHILAKGASGCDAASYALYTGPSGGLVFYFSNEIGLGLSPDAGAGVWDGAWHHVAGVMDGSHVRLYVDGVQVGTGTPTASSIGYGLTTTNDFLIGAYRGTCADNNFDGHIDEPRIWSRALSEVEVAASAAMGHSANELSYNNYGNDYVVFTSHFENGTDVTISLESSSGERTIAKVEVEAKKKRAPADCGVIDSNECLLTLSNGGRTAALTVAPEEPTTKRKGVFAKLRVTLDNGQTFGANVG